MNTQNIAREEWVIWKPHENVPTKCWVDIVNNTPQSLNIILSDEKETRTIFLDFNYNFYMCKVSEETCTLELLDDTIAKYGKAFIFDSAFFIIHNSSYVEWLIQQSNGLLQVDNLYHYCIFGVNSVVDVIASQEPKVTIT